MTTIDPESLTRLMNAAGQGDASAREKLFKLVYDELHGIARQQMARERPGQTLQPTALVHEAFIRIFGKRSIEWASRRHFYNAFAQAMYRIRIDAARHRDRQKRGGGQQRIPLGEEILAFEDDPVGTLALAEALEKLKQIRPRAAEVVKYLHFGGLTVDETVEAMEISPRTVDGDRQFARAWLHRELRKGDTSDTGAGAGVRTDGPGPMGKNPGTLRAGAEPEA